LHHVRSFVALVLDKFPKRLTATDGIPHFVELPGANVIGIRPALYNMLRMDLLSSSDKRASLGLCPECDDFFSVRRAGSLYCSNRCASRMGSRRNWHGPGKNRRRERKRKALEGQKRRKRESYRRRVAQS
jgi:hypothetical protein